jgi:hypothetical protein
MLRATIVDHSLSDKSILDKLQIEKTYQSGTWTLHNVLIDESMIPELAKAMDSGPWYIHVWQPGQDSVKVVFKNRIFEIQHSDKTTWKEALEYGKSIGIPEEELDFPIQ